MKYYLFQRYYSKTLNSMYEPGEYDKSSLPDDLLGSIFIIPVNELVLVTIETEPEKKSFGQSFTPNKLKQRYYRKVNLLYDDEKTMQKVTEITQRRATKIIDLRNNGELTEDKLINTFKNYDSWKHKVELTKYNI